MCHRASTTKAERRGGSGETSKKNRGNGASSFARGEEKKKGTQSDSSDEAIVGFGSVGAALHFARLFSPSRHVQQASATERPHTYRIPKILLSNHPSCQNHIGTGLPETLMSTVMSSKSDCPARGPTPHTCWFVYLHIARWSFPPTFPS